MFVILTVCMIANPHLCREDRIRQSVEEGPPLACLVEGQSTVAMWGQEHPAWHIERWKCVPSSRLDQAL